LDRLKRPLFFSRQFVGIRGFRVLELDQTKPLNDSQPFGKAIQGPGETNFAFCTMTGFPTQAASAIEPDQRSNRARPTAGTSTFVVPMPVNVTVMIISLVLLLGDAHW
jgi:hypothetical protein